MSVVRGWLSGLGWWLVQRFSEDADCWFADDLKIVYAHPEANFTWIPEGWEGTDG